MKHSILALAAALLATISICGLQAEAQQEVDPTPYPLVHTVQDSPQRTTSARSAKQGSGHSAQHAMAKRTKKASTGGAHHDTAKTAALR